jgi:hypothetical protein
VDSICFVDGARFSDVHGLLRALRVAVEEMQGPEGCAEALQHVLSGRTRDDQGPARFHIVWLNSDVSRRTLGAQPVVPGRGGESAFDAATRRLAACRSIELILL